MYVKYTGASSVVFPSSSGSRYAFTMVPCLPFAIRSVLTLSKSYFSWMGYDLPQPERKHLASSCFCVFCVDNGVEAGTGAGAGTRAGGEVLGACVRCIFLGCSIEGVHLRGAVGPSFGVDALRIFFFFLKTTSFHSLGGERSVVVSRSVAVVGVLGLTSCGALLSSVVGDGVKHTASLKEAANLGFRYLDKFVVVFGSRSLLVSYFPLWCGSGKLTSYFQLDNMLPLRQPPDRSADDRQSAYRQRTNFWYFDSIHIAG